MVAQHTQRQLRLVLRPLKNRASLVRADKTLYDVRTNGRALHCDNFDRIWSHLNSVHVNYSDAT